jgi:GAF domain-containing protein
LYLHNFHDGIISAAQENADQCSNELERLRTELQRSDEDKKRLEEEVTQVSTYYRE